MGKLISAKTPMLDSSYYSQVMDDKSEAQRGSKAQRPPSGFLYSKVIKHRASAIAQVVHCTTVPLFRERHSQDRHRFIVIIF